MTRASDLARLIGAGGTVANDVTISEGSPSIKLNDTDTSRFIDILYGTRNATFRNTMASGEDMDTVAPETIFSTKDDGETREHFRMNKSEAVFNEGSADLDFRVESNDNANMLVVDGGINAVGIGGGVSTNYQLKVSKSDGSVQQLLSAAANFNSTIAFGDDSSNTSGEIIYAHNGDSMRFHTNGSEHMRIDSSGNVGIGKTNPTGKLHVNGASGSDQLIVGNTSESTQFRVRNLEDDQVRLYARDGDSARHMVFYTGITERMRINTSGYVGIGTNNPTEPFQVYSGDYNGAVARFLNIRDTSNANGIKVTIGATGGASGTNSTHFHGNTNAVGNWYLYANGTMSYSSDERLKKNIETTRDGYLEDLAKLRVVKYNWNCDKDGDNKELGLIAQEVEKVFPNLVKDDTNPISEDDSTMYKQLKQSVLPMMLLKALQEANTKITALEARITALESK